MLVCARAWYVCIYIYSVSYTYNNIIIAFVSVTTFRTFPILIPNMSTQWHVIASYSFALYFGRTSFGNIKLFLCSLRPIRCTCRGEHWTRNITSIRLKLRNYGNLLPHLISVKHTSSPCSHIFMLFKHLSSLSS